MWFIFVFNWNNFKNFFIGNGISSGCYFEERNKQYEEVKAMYLKTMDNLLLLLEKEYYDKHYRSGITKFFDNNKLVKELNAFFWLLS